MEDIWEDIILSSSLQNSPVSPNPKPTNSILSSIQTMSYKRSLDDNGCAVNHRHKRMMRNRESAARSRARRQVYTFELEKDKSKLTEENDRLRRELRELELCAAADATVENEAPKNNNLSRSLSALF